MIIIGDAGVGKTSLLLKHVNPNTTINDEHEMTIGVEFSSSTYTSENNDEKKYYNMQIWDTAGSRTF